MDSLYAPSLSSQTSSLRAAQSVGKVRRLLLDKVKAGVVVNPYYQGLLNKIYGANTSPRPSSSLSVPYLNNP